MELSASELSSAASLSKEAFEEKFVAIVAGRAAAPGKDDVSLLRLGGLREPEVADEVREAVDRKEREERRMGGRSWRREGGRHVIGEVFTGQKGGGRLGGRSGGGV
ncbi:hypothetical protein LTR62_002023 [Meristemomyces frigidus]|uniref:Uncharacterized protein n=1 Tax=Meristemomyces frigidus TaxID=1508187 RepID=A0AAN7TH15_9PEZI|nr:hypothetical protein LTR62_002023 [Meristemomyces frigidus]